jgi:ABC-type glycerol-3-phosphate transport system permease component
MRRSKWIYQVAYQAALALLLIFVLVPLLNLFRIAFDGTIKLAPMDFRLWPKEFTLDTLLRVWQHPSQDLSMWDLLRNSLIVSGGSALLSAALGLSMAYAFARMRFSGQRMGLFGLLLGSLMPPVALMTPLYVLLTLLGIRTTLFGLMLVYTAFAMPFCVWSMRSTFQAVPRELEEAAFLDGAGMFKTFWLIDLPLALPSITVAVLVAFLTGYTEFALGWLFVESSQNVTIAMALSGMVNYSGAIWGSLSALVILMGLPVVLIFLFLHRYLVKGLLMGIVES